MYIDSWNHDCGNVHVLSHDTQSNLRYQSDLWDQMMYQQQRVSKEAAQTSRELTMAAREEALYQERLQAALSQPVMDKTHPRRLMAARK